MHNLAIVLRAAQLTAHAAHNLASGDCFFGDHEQLAEWYAAYESAYDAVVERMIGTGMQLDLVVINKAAADQMTAPTIGAAFQVLATMEVSIQAQCEAYSGTSIGTDNLLAGLADDSERRAYLIGRRLLPDSDD